MAWPCQEGGDPAHAPVSRRRLEEQGSSRSSTPLKEGFQAFPPALPRVNGKQVGLQVTFFYLGEFSLLVAGCLSYESGIGQYKKIMLLHVRLMTDIFRNRTGTLHVSFRLKDPPLPPDFGAGMVPVIISPSRVAVHPNFWVSPVLETV